METREFNRHSMRSVRSRWCSLGLLATAFGIAATAHMTYGAVQFVLSFVAA